MLFRSLEIATGSHPVKFESPARQSPCILVLEFNGLQPPTSLQTATADGLTTPDRTPIWLIGRTGGIGYPSGSQKDDCNDLFHRPHPQIILPFGPGVHPYGA